MAEASSTEDVITLRIRFKSETLERFIERYGGDLGPDEVFVRTRQPLSSGTPIAFDFTLNDSTPLLDGRGVVIWTRTVDESHAGPPGMGIKFTSLSAQSWQTLRKVLAASGRAEAEAVTPVPVPQPVARAPFASAIRRPTPLGPPAQAPQAAAAAAQALLAEKPAKRPEPSPSDEDAERTEVARVPPNFFELAADGGPRNLDRGMNRLPAAPTSSQAAKTPREGRMAVPSYEQEPIESLGLEDVEDVEDATNVRGGPAWPGAGRMGSAPASVSETAVTNTRAEPQWPTSPTPPTSPAVDPAALGLAAARTGAARSTSPARGTAAPVAPNQRAGGSQPGWPAAATPGQGVPAKLGGGQAAAPPADPGLSTAPTLPATAAVLLYDPDEPGGLVPAGQAAGPAAVAPQPSGPVPTGPSSNVGSASQTGGRSGTKDSSGLFFPPNAPAGALPAGYQARLFQPGADGPRYPEGGFDDQRQPGFPSGRSSVGRIGPAISPEEMALASSAVRGPENDAPLWPGQADDLDGPRGGTFKIWLALTLAAGGLIGAVLWLLPLMWPGIPSAPPATNPGPAEAPVVETPAAAPAAGAGKEPATPPGPAADKPAQSTPPAAPGAAAQGEPTAAAVGKGASEPSKAKTDAPAEAPAPTRPTRAAAAKAAESRAGGDEDRPAPRPSRRRARRDPGEVLAEAEARDRAPEPTSKPPGEAPSGGVPTAPGAGLAPPAAGATGSSPAPSPPVAPASGLTANPLADEASEEAYWLSVRSTPTGADVLIDGQSEGKTPFQRRIFDPNRTYTLVVRKPGFSSVERTVSAASEWSKRGNLHTLTVTAKLDALPGAAPESPATVPPPLTPPPTKTNPFDEPAPGARP